MIKRKRFCIFIVFLLCLLSVISCIQLMFYWVNTPLLENRFTAKHTIPNEQILIIPHGSSLHDTSSLLFEKGWIDYPKLWVLYAKVTSQTAIKAGEYRFDANYSPDAMLKKLIKADVFYRSIQFIEGQTFKQFLSLLEQQQGLNKKLVSTDMDSVIKQLGLNLDHLEGWLFPDTYYFSLGESDIDLLHRAYKKMQAVLTQYWESRAPNLPYKNAYEALIMASIIEKETGAAFERADIAGVFVNRLNKRMRLQTDPTVIYGMGDAFQGDIKSKHLKTPTPYNTYTHHGLPPTPISMPSEMAIKAALNPNVHDFIFFVGKGDGTHHFSVTLKEHNQAVRRYQLTRVKNYRSTIK